MKQEKDQSANSDRSPSTASNRSAPASGGSGGEKTKGTASPVQFPTLSLPKGGGIGEKFQANGSLSGPLPTFLKTGRLIRFVFFFSCKTGVHPVNPAANKCSATKKNVCS